MESQVKSEVAMYMSVGRYLAIRALIPVLSLVFDNKEARMQSQQPPEPAADQTLGGLDARG